MLIQVHSVDNDRQIEIPRGEGFEPRHLPYRQEKITAHINRSELIQKRVCWEENERTKTETDIRRESHLERKYQEGDSQDFGWRRVAVSGRYSP